MAAFTALALGLGLLGGKLASDASKRRQAASPPIAPPVSAPAPTTGSLAAPAPPDATLAASTAAKAAAAAATKQRRKGNTGITGTGLGSSSIAAPGSKLAPKSLSGY